jgi:threonyl-tRNA synthetase
MGSRSVCVNVSGPGGSSSQPRWRYARLAGEVPVLIAIGRKEASENTVSARRLGSNAQSTMGADEAIAALAKEACRRICGRLDKKGQSDWEP